MAATTSKDQDGLILVGVATLLAVLFVTINAERKKKFDFYFAQNLIVLFRV